MAGQIVHDFPLFPLGLVALPGEVVPLHIFEQRYRTMIGECLDSGHEFGIVWAETGEIRAVGCAMEVTQLLEELEDGRMNILTKGTRPFRVVEEVHHLPYPAGVVEFLEDQAEVPDEPARESAHEAYARLVEEATDKVLEDEELEPLTAYDMAATVEFGLDAKQGLLDLRSENARLSLVTRLLRAVVKRLDFVERAQVRARSNGRVRF
jgi:Lon protease-like protein